MSNWIGRIKSSLCHSNISTTKTYKCTDAKKFHLRQLIELFYLSVPRLELLAFVLNVVTSSKAAIMRLALHSSSCTYIISYFLPSNLIILCPALVNGCHKCFTFSFSPVLALFHLWGLVINHLCKELKICDFKYIKTWFVYLDYLVL